MYYLNSELNFISKENRAHIIAIRRFGCPCFLGFIGKSDEAPIMDIEKAYNKYSVCTEVPEVVALYPGNQFSRCTWMPLYGKHINFHVKYEQVLQQLKHVLSAHCLKEDSYVLPEHLSSLRNIMCQTEDVGISIEHLYCTIYLPKDYLVLGKLIDADEDDPIPENILHGMTYGKSGYGYQLRAGIDQLIRDCIGGKRIRLYIAIGDVELQGDDYDDRRTGGYYRVHNYDTSRNVLHIMTGKAGDIQSWLATHGMLLTGRVAEQRRII